jgi:haloalkane dehalogenase
MWVHGLGGPVGLALAGRRPEWFRGLVISDTFAYPLDEFLLGRNMMRLVGSGGFSRLNRATNLMAHAMSSPFGAGRCLSAEGRAVFRAAYGTDERRRYGSRMMRSCVESRTDLKQIEAGLRNRAGATPTLILFGEKDNAIRLGFEARFKEIFPRAEKARVKGAHHFPMGDDPNAVADFIRAWWGAQFEPDRMG